MRSAAVKIFVAHGDPKQLRTAELSNWTGKAVAGPRGEFESVLAREKSQKSGVYFRQLDDTGQVDQGYGRRHGSCRVCSKGRRQWSTCRGNAAVADLSSQGLDATFVQLDLLDEASIDAVATAASCPSNDGNQLLRHPGGDAGYVAAVAQVDSGSDCEPVQHLRIAGFER